VIGLGLGTGIADPSLTYLRLLSTKTYHISYGGPELDALLNVTLCILYIAHWY